MRFIKPLAAFLLLILAASALMAQQRFRFRSVGGTVYLDKTFEDSSLSDFLITCRQDPGNVACNETTNFACRIDSTVAYAGTKSVLCEGNIDPASDYTFRNDLQYTFVTPKNPAVTDNALYYGFRFRINQDALTCIGTGTTQVNQLKLSLARATDATGGWAMPIFGRLNGPTANGDDFNFNGDGFGTAALPGPGSQHLFDMDADIWYGVKVKLTRDTANSRGTITLWYDSGSGWTLTEWKSDGTDSDSEPTTHTNSNHGWNSTTLAQTLRFPWSTSASTGSGADCTGRVGKVWMDNLKACNYDCL